MRHHSIGFNIYKITIKFIHFISCAAIDAATSIGVDRSQIVHHASVSRTAGALNLQLIIVDRYEYNAVSSRLMEHLKRTILNELYQSECIDESLSQLITTSVSFLCRPIKVLFQFGHAIYAQCERSRFHIHFRNVVSCDAVYDTDLYRLLR